MPGAGRTHGPRAKKVRGALTTGTAETSRHSLHDGLRLIRALLGEPAFATVTRAKLFSYLRELGACMGAQGPHDFAVRVCAATSIGTSTSTAFRTTFVTTRTPLFGAERAQHTEKQNF